MMNFEGYKKAVFEIVLRTGSKVSKENGDKRIEVCKKCDHYKEIVVLGFIKCMGCEICGCPSETKAYMKSWINGEVKCPHPVDGNKWEEIDNKFKP